MSKIIKKSKDNLSTRNYHEEEKVSEIFEWYENAKLQNPLEFWREASLSSNPIKKELAKYYLTPPATSVDVVRLFSTAGDILTKETNRILPEKAEMILFCRENLPLLNFKY